MSRRKQQNPQHVNENPTPGQTNQSCFNEKTFFCDFGKKPDRFQGGDRNGEESRGACEDNSHNLQSASRADVDSDCSSDAASMADLGVDDNDGDGKPKMLRGADAFSQNSPSQNIHNDDTLDASFRQLRQSSEKSVEAMSSTEAIVSCNSNGTYNEKEMLDPLEANEKAAGDFAVYQAQEVGSPSSHLAGSERNLRDGRSDGLSNSKRAILQQDQEDEPVLARHDSELYETGNGRAGSAFFNKLEEPKSEPSLPDEDHARQFTPEEIADNENEVSEQSEVIGSKDISEIKDQVRKLQQQQMYQIQMLNYLHFQLTVFASSNAPPQRSPNFFPSQSFPQVNGFQFQGMPQLFAAAASMATGNQMPATTSEHLPNAPSLLGRHLAVGGDDQHYRVRNPNDCSSESKKLKRKIDAENTFSALYSPSAGSHAVSMVASSNAEETDDGYGERKLKQEAQTAKHSCHLCQKVFGSDSALQIHLRSHTGERPYKCNICANRFTTKGNLKVHFVRHKEKHPHIEMNAEPVPEYLDNIPTENGIPFGMSVAPISPERQENVQEVKLPSSPDSTEVGAQLEEGEDYVRTNSVLMEGQKNGENKTTSVRGDADGNAKSQKDADYKTQSLMYPITLYSDRKNDVAEDTARAVYAKSSRLSPSDDNVDERCDKNGEASITGTTLKGPISGSNVTSSSETSKLQRLVDQIDRGKDLEKNECHICRRVLSCQSALKLHYRTHTGERPHKCDLCDRAFTTRGNLRTHYSSVHRQQLRPSPPQGGSATRSGVMQCPLCLSRFMDQQSMQQHMQMHLYMQTQHLQQQQQQHIAQFMTGQAEKTRISSSAADSRRSIPRSPSGRHSATEQIDGNLSGNDDVFNPTSPNRTASPKSQKSPQSTAVPLADVAISRRSPIELKSAQAQMADEDTKSAHSLALDLTRTSSRSDGTPSPGRNPARNELDRASPSSANHSLNALAHLASNSSLTRTGLTTVKHQNTAPDEEPRPRKMTASCEICNKPFSCQSALEIHLRSHTKERPYVCRVCDRGFTTKGNLKQHLLTHNITEVDEDMLEPVSSPARGNSISGSPSNSPSATNGSQQSAVKRPAAEPVQAPAAAKQSYPRHWCHICQKQFSSASSLQIHNRTHTGEKPFACSVCGRAFTTKGNLKVHMGTHVWGAGGSRRGRRISMDNPLISPWMQNTSGNIATNNSLRNRAPPTLAGVTTPAALYQQYAAIASGLMGAKAADHRFHGNGMMNLNSVAAARLLMPQANGHSSSPNSVSSPPQHLTAADAMNAEDGKCLSTAEWFWRAYQRTQEQVN